MLLTDAICTDNVAVLANDKVKKEDMTMIEGKLDSLAASLLSEDK